ncbi:GGDEF domain-containing protein [Rhodobacter sp. Har01]|uniref:GGDEF domain-containing protein n=1 Tax=Rhodobacter sp. Har01 TaxID=2883999 RepID=UPI001D08EC45|nr:GGDEF domain-containing protein [Rhodobacter sp. Har01]MCB6178345.1 GGDEF domain-containing protein [Rhodobacter sp. Har01]
MAERRSRHRRRSEVTLRPQVLAWLMPMHVVLSASGRVRQVGPTLKRLFAGQRLVGRSILSLFEMRGPTRIADMAAFADRAGHKLNLIPRGEVPALRLRGVAVPLGRPDDGWLLNLSFGIDCPRAVAMLHLSDADFAPTDMTMEVLYLAEANAAVMGEMRAMSGRLDGARVQAEEEALTDPLTGLRNRRASDSLLARQCRERMAFALLHLDLDYFKQVNDWLGHAAGDHVLVAVAAVLRRVCRAMDSLARVGGDEFVLILPGMTDGPRIARIAERIVDELKQPILFKGEICRISGSIGYVIVREGEAADPSGVLAAADVALYAAKQAGRGRVNEGKALPRALNAPARPPARPPDGPTDGPTDGPSARVAVPGE